jgi:hypothetical protein
VEIEVRLPREVGWHGGKRSVSVTLCVPAEADLEVHTGDGAIRLAGLSADHS